MIDIPTYRDNTGTVALLLNTDSAENLSRCWQLYSCHVNQGRTSDYEQTRKQDLTNTKHGLLHLQAFNSFQGSYRFIRNRSLNVYQIYTEASRVNHQTPGLEYSKWRTLRQTSRTVLSCPSLPLSPSLSPAGLIAKYKRPPSFTGSITAVSISSGGLAVVTSPPASSSRHMPAATSHSQQPYSSTR
jgi:hypothetical protein